MINSILKHRIILLLVLIFLLAGFLRFYKIDQIPVSLYWDEVSIAINSNFIAETGRDEYGHRLPLLFKAFNDYKSPGNIYLTVIPVKLFGLSEFSARFVSAFLGTFLVIIMFFLGKSLGELSKKKINTDYLGILCAFLLSISPWHIQFSRSGFEANSGLFFVTLAITLFILFINKKDYKFFFPSAIFFAISCYFYRSELIFAPLFFLFLLLLNYRTLLIRKNIVKSILGIAIFFFVLLPFIPAMATSEGMSRGNQVSIFNPDNSFDKVVESSRKLEVSNKNLISKIIYNRRISYADLFLENYTSYFGYNFLFKWGDSNERHNVMGMGQFYLWQLPFLLIGLFYLFKIRKKAAAIIISWILIAAIPAALSVPDSHALRSLNMLPAFILLISFGIFALYIYLPKKTHLWISLIFAIIITISFFHYVNLYKKSSILYGKSWGDGYMQLFNYLGESNHQNNGKILISGHYWQPYAYALFYTGYHPKAYLTSGSRSSFDKYVFGGTSWEKEEEFDSRMLAEYAKNKNNIFALSPVEYSTYWNNLDIIKVIKNNNNEVVFIVVKPK